MRLDLVTAPSVTPISVSEVKTHLRIDHALDDTYLGTLIDVATAHVDGADGILGRALVTQTWKVTLPWFPCDEDIDLPLPPLASVTHVKYYDTDNTLQTMSSSDYEVVSERVEGCVQLKPTASWPATYERTDAVIVTYVAGYGNAAAVPAPIRHALLLGVGDLYTDRGDGSANVTGAMSAYRRLLDPFRVLGER